MRGRDGRACKTRRRGQQQESATGRQEDVTFFSVGWEGKVDGCLYLPTSPCVHPLTCHSFALPAYRPPTKPPNHSPHPSAYHLTHAKRRLLVQTGRMTWGEEALPPLAPHYPSIPCCWIRPCLRRGGFFPTRKTHDAPPPFHGNSCGVTPYLSIAVVVPFSTAGPGRQACVIYLLLPLAGASGLNKVSHLIHGPSKTYFLKAIFCNLCNPSDRGVRKME